MTDCYIHVSAQENIKNEWKCRNYVCMSEMIDLLSDPEIELYANDACFDFNDFSLKFLKN